MKLPPTSPDQMPFIYEALGEGAVKKIEAMDMTLIDTSVLHRLLIEAGFSAAEIEQAQAEGTTSALTRKLLTKAPLRQPSTRKNLINWLVKGALVYQNKSQHGRLHQRRLVFACVGDSGAELGESFWEQLEAQTADPDVKE